MNEATVTRVFEAPRDRVWKAFTRPEEFATWFSTPPFTTPPETVSLDVREGGAWRATMVHEAEGTELPFLGTYREVAPPERLVFTYEDPLDRANPDVEVATVTFDEADAGTRVVYRQSGNLPADEYPRIEEGVGSFFDRLASHLGDA